MFHITNHWRFGNKPKRVKDEVYAAKKRMRTISIIITVFIVASLIILASYYLPTYFANPDSETNENGGDSVDVSLKAALIDPLYDTLPNEEFTSSLKETLRNAGFEDVDVFHGAEVTVDFLKGVPDGYRLIILRMHSALHNDGLYLFTAEPYSVGKYTDEQYFRLVKEAYVTDDSQSVFAVNWGFVKRCMTGTFNGTLVIMMGCDGALDPLIIKEFMNQGAVGYISWDGPVLLYHSDAATLRLVDCLYGDSLSVDDAIETTNKQAGADPEWGSVLVHHLP